MKNQLLRSLLSFAILSAVTVCTLRAQNNPATGAAPGGAARGGFGRGGFGRGGFNRGPQVPPGPPAPVPPQVTMLRPSSNEVARMNVELKKFIETSPAKELLQKYEPLVMVQVPRDNPCIRPHPSARGGRHQGFADFAKTNEFDILFDGDSITDLWNVEQDPFGNPGGKNVFKKYFSDVKVANFGVSGDTTQGVLWGLQNGEGQGHKPKAVMLMIGTNNSGTYTAPEIAEGVGAVVLEMRKDFPNAKILLLAIFPRSVPGDPVRDKIAEVNRIISKLDDQQHVFFMDIGANFLGADGFFLPDAFRADNLHPQAKGYDIWGTAVQAKLAELMK